MQNKLEVFIVDNKLLFKEGERNTNCVTLSGYALHLGIEDVEIVIKAVINSIPRPDDFEDELKRVFEYAKTHNYKKWWEKKKNKKLWVTI